MADESHFDTSNPRYFEENLEAVDAYVSHLLQTSLDHQSPGREGTVFDEVDVAYDAEQHTALVRGYAHSSVPLALSSLKKAVQAARFIAHGSETPHDQAAS
jgi:hypothetical protein